MKVVSNLTASVLATILYDEFENYYTLKIIAKSLRGQWVDSLRPSDAYMSVN